MLSGPLKVLQLYVTVLVCIHQTGIQVYCLNNDDLLIFNKVLFNSLLSSIRRPHRFSTFLLWSRSGFMVYMVFSLRDRIRSTCARFSTQLFNMNTPRRGLFQISKIIKRGITSQNVYNGFQDAVGNTPLIKLKYASEITGCNIMAKAEMLNPGGSVKDRAALYLIKEAVENGLKPGGTIVEGTAGNTGIGLAHLCLTLGYKCVIYIPDDQTQEKIDMLKALGAEVHPVPRVPFSNPLNFNKRAQTHALENANTVWTNQFDNTANRRAHYETTGPEIWEQTNGKVDCVIFSTGTGGTLSGCGTFLKERNSNVKVWLADPEGSVLFNYYNSGVLEAKGSGSITQGIGQGRLTDNLNGSPIDNALHITDKQAVEWTFRLLHEDGFFVGSSSGLNVAAAVQAAQELGPGHTIVTCLCDSGQRYFANLFSRSWLEGRELLHAVPEKYRPALFA